MTNYIISADTTIREALGRLNALPGDVMTLVVSDGNGHAAGTLTDGDIRRGILNGASLDDKVGLVMFTRFTALRTGMDGRERVELMRDARKNLIKLLPELDSDGAIVGLHNLARTRSCLPLQALLMAGGKGVRLQPATLSLPKPLLPLAGRPIIDYNVEKLAFNGISDIYVSVNYMADKMKAHFAQPHYGVTVKCVAEPMAMGTIGAASLIPLPDDGATLVMNSDLITTIDLEEFYLRHCAEEADITIAVTPYSVAVPYAIVTTEGERVKALEEKPSYSYLANAGIYIFSNRILRRLPRDSRTDAPDLIEATIAAGGKVIYYIIKGVWIDVGSPADFRHAEELLAHHSALTAQS